MISNFISKTRRALSGLKNRRGQTLVEYAIILAMVSVVAIAVLVALGGQIKGIFTTISSQISAAQSSH